MSTRPLPEVTDENRHFWQGGENNKLQFLHCEDCDYLVHPPSPVCPKCYEQSLQVKAVSGNATLASYTINHQPWMPDLKVPYAIAIISIDEQPSVRLTTNIVGCDIADIHIDMPVEVTFEQHDDVWLPLFKPRTAANKIGAKDGS